MSTLSEIVIAVRELAFDRFPIPEFILKQKATKFVTNNSTHFKILPSAGSGTPDYSYAYNPDEANDTLENLTNALVGNNFPVAYTGYYSATNKVGGLLKLTDAPLGAHVTFYRRFFCSDLNISTLILEYYENILNITTETLSTLPTSVQLLNKTTVRHLTLWAALTIIEARRLNAQSASAFSYNFTDGTGAVAGSNLNSPGDSINVSVGSVFSITDDNSISSQYFSENYNMVGSDNVLGDKDTFWFKLFLHLRKKLEGEFKDYSFRDDQVIVGSITLDKSTDGLNWFGSFPWTTSPLARGLF